MLDTPRPKPASPSRAALRIGHGCDGKPTRQVIVSLPEGLRGAKPQPKPGWTLQVTKAPLKTPYESHGKPVLEDTVEVRWTANTEADYLQDAWFDEFVLRATAPAQPGVLWFKGPPALHPGRMELGRYPQQRDAQAARPGRQAHRQAIGRAGRPRPLRARP